ncbi:peptide methionine sulfoxide reductase [Methanolacinia petrolearia DSM 11571]|uniref:Peptide methionine sulfoxide reductase MsrA n=1 Tax=Methanolacinia petrolearia (strain DSM 11571 / OCM 486 / SEBR 4847) TaxID=679926 RepID=E1REN0_METP4|nr:peptide-methionine (S)-S-oxide reductase MsrA [Methanolacinia petrolearia]ADN34977.1 peptide methionine sulfoxide reductase [Methanolacinia petrolearia DSM 11571]
MSEETVVFAGGCFWHVEEAFGKVRGVIRTRVGYTGGKLDNPCYEDVCTGNTGHAEAVEVTFAPEAVSYRDLLKEFFNMHDPTTLNKQGPDVGTQYRSAIFCRDELQKNEAENFVRELEDESRFGGKEIVTEVVPLGKFWEAEEYHQKYLFKIRNQGVNPECRVDLGKRE